MKRLLHVLLFFPVAISAQNVGIGTSMPLSKLDISAEGDGAEILRLSSARPWVFKQTDTGPDARLTLRSTVNFKSFEIVSPDGLNRAADFYVSDAVSQVKLVPDEGEVGIGTDTIDGKLHVKGVGSFSNPHLRLTQEGDGNARLKLENTTYPDAYWEMFARPHDITGASKLYLYHHNPTTSGAVFTINGFGNVGLGTQFPSSRLHILYNSSIGFPQLRLTEEGDDFARLKMENTLNPGAYWDIAGKADTLTGESRLNFYFANSTTSGDRMTIVGNGNIGIGKTNPSAKLDIQTTGDGSDLLRFSTDRPWRFRQTGTGSSSNLSLQNAFITSTFEILAADSSHRAAVFYSSLPESEVYLVPEVGQVGIGTDNPTHKLHVEGTVYAVGSPVGGHAVHGTTAATGAWAVYGNATHASGEGIGVFGKSNGDSGTGVYGTTTGTSAEAVFGLATATTGSTKGVYGNASSSQGIGVYGAAPSPTGNTYGVYGFVNSTSGTGVRGWVNATSGTTYGVHGTAVSSAGTGVYGQASASSGTTRGVYGLVNSPEGTAVRGHANASSGTNYGVHGSTNSSSGTAVYGHATATGSATNFGVHGEVSSQGTGVFGENTRASGAATGVWGRSSSTSGTGVYGSCTATTGTNYGVWGTTPSTSGRGVYGIANATSGTTYGVYGNALSSAGSGVYGTASGESGKAIYGYATGTYGKGVHAISTGTHSSVNALLAQATGGGNAYAAWFSGKVHVDGNLSKASGSFKIDHPLDPENKYLYHSFVESPDMMNIYNGNVVTDASGYAEVELPEYFDALNMDFRYQLTVIGEFAQAIVAEKINDNRFSIKTDKPNIEVSWLVTGIRKDPWAEAHRIQPEVLKEPENRGKYLTPEVYGAAPEAAVVPISQPETIKHSTINH